MESGVTTSGVNLRESANATAKILRVVPKGTTVTVLDRTALPWLHVRVSDILEGFLHADYVKVTAAEISSAPPTVSPTPSAAPPVISEAPPTTDTPAPVSPPAQVVPVPPPPQFAGSATPDLSGLYQYIENIPSPEQHTVPQTYYDFWNLREKLGLPAPFDVSPVFLSDPAKLPVNGFGPNTFAFNNWTNWYTRVCGMHNGLDHNIPAKTPLLALSDGIIVGDRQAWPFMGSRYEKTLVLWCFLPESVKDANGNRMLSNVLVAYGHMSDNSVAKKGQVVKAGQILGYSGFPHNEDADTGKMIEQPGNAHLHLEVHLLSGDNNLPYPRKRQPGLLRAYKRPQPFDNNTPFNPMLFFTERIIRYHQHQSVVMGRKYPDEKLLKTQSIKWPALDFFSVAYFQYPGVRYANIIWKTKNPPPWPTGVYDLPTALKRMETFTPFEPYPIPQM